MSVHDFARHCAEKTWSMRGYEVVRALLESPKYEEFREACNAISMGSYLSLESIGVTYDMYNVLRRRANEITRERIGPELSEIFDKLVRWSKEELWGGDELYKLYDFAMNPYYVSRCIKGALWLRMRMKKPINTLEEVREIALKTSSPPYWEIRREVNYKASDYIREELEAWNHVAELLYNKEWEEAYSYINSIGGEQEWR